MSDSIDLIATLQTALETRRLAEARVIELRHEIVTRDLPRPWWFSHERISGWVRDVPARLKFESCVATRAEVEGKLREAIRALPWDRSERFEVRAVAWSADTGESVDLSVPIEQAEPACVHEEGHEWVVRFLEESPIEGHPRGRRVTEGCPHCDGRKTTVCPDTRCFPDSLIITYDAPHHYPEGTVRRCLASLEPSP